MMTAAPTSTNISSAAAQSWTLRHPTSRAAITIAATYMAPKSRAKPRMSGQCGRIFMGVA